MIHFLRKIRHSQIQGENMKKYVFYAIGEIMLVVVGILLALQIDNWNESKKEDEKLMTIFETVKNDMIRDTLKYTQTITLLEEANIKFNAVISNNANDQELFQSLFLMDTYQPITINLKGIDLLRSYSNSKISINDSLMSETLDIYTYYENLIHTYAKRTEDLVLKNIDDWSQNEAWFSTYTLESFKSDPNSSNYNTEFINDFLVYAKSGHEYKNKVSKYYIHTLINIRLLKGFIRSTRTILAKMKSYGVK